MELLAGIGIGTYPGGGKTFVLTYLWVTVLLVSALTVPNTAQIMRAYRPTANRFPSEDAYSIDPLRRWMAGFRWRPNTGWAMTLAVVAGLGLLALTSVSEFLYFQF